MDLLQTNAFRRWAIPFALGLYAFLGALLIAQKPGLQYDEALLVEGAVQLRHSTAELPMPHTAHTWACIRHHCFPVMGEGEYIGAVKDYFCLPLFALFGPTAEAARLGSLLLAMIGIWGIARLIAQHVSPSAGAAVALILAVNPAYLNMTVFDNGVVAPMMAGLGLICAFLATYINRKSALAAFGVGAAIGFAVWARANFLWTVIGCAIAAVLVFRRQLRIPAIHCLAIAAGGFVGGFPFLYYQYVSHGATLFAVQDYSISAPLTKLIPLRLFWLADTLLSDGEHRVMWAASPSALVQLPEWQLWLFPLVVLGAITICILSVFESDSQRAAPWSALSLVLVAIFLFSSHLPITEHHLIALTPLAVIVVVLAAAIIEHRLPQAWILSASLAAIYLACAGYWELATLHGLRTTGGTGVWSDAGSGLARYLEQQYPNREINLLDWGLQTNLFVLTDGRLNSVELWPAATRERTPSGQTWTEALDGGGIFVLTGPHDRTFPAPVEGFLEAWNAAQPATRTHRIAQRNGATYAEILDVAPHTLHRLDAANQRATHTIAMTDPQLDQRSSGLYELQPAGWRWTQPLFSLNLDGPDLPDSPVTLSVHVFVPPQSIDALGPVTLSARIGAHDLPPETYRQQGQYVFQRTVPGEWLNHGTNRFEFHLDKHLGPGPGYPKELGIVLTSASLEAE